MHNKKSLIYGFIIIIILGGLWQTANHRVTPPTTTPAQKAAKVIQQQKKAAQKPQRYQNHQAKWPGTNYAKNSRFLRSNAVLSSAAVVQHENTEGYFYQKVTAAFPQGQPNFSPTELQQEQNAQNQIPFIVLSPLDEAGRTQQANALLMKEALPTAKRSPRLTTKPSGWHQQITPQGHLYERSHLIGYQFSGLNDVPENLITGTHVFNASTAKGMLRFETMVKKAVDAGAIVRYQVTPLYDGSGLLPLGVQMMAVSVNNNNGPQVNITNSAGKFQRVPALPFNVYISNAQSDFQIDYSTGRAVGNVIIK